MKKLLGCVLIFTSLIFFGCGDADQKEIDTNFESLLSDPQNDLLEKLFFAEQLDHSKWNDYKQELNLNKIDRLDSIHDKLEYTQNYDRVKFDKMVDHLIKKYFE